MSETHVNLNELLDAQNRQGALARLFPPEMGQDTCDLLVVGGGLAGILLALRMSRPDLKGPRKIVLCERESQLGGRLFFSTPIALHGTAHERFESSLSACEQGGRHLSGFGFEAFDAHAVEVVERHLMSHLTDSERDFVENFVKRAQVHSGHSEQTAHSTQPTQPVSSMQTEAPGEVAEVAVAQAGEKPRRCYVVKKEFTTLERVLQGSSEIYTKKEAENLEKLFAEMPAGSEPDEAEAFSESEVGSSMGVKSFEQSTFWTGLPKVQKEALGPLLETLLGDRYGKCSERSVRLQAHSFFESLKKPLSSAFSRMGGLELALRAILQSRGVEVRTSCQVARLNYLPDTKTYEALLGDEVNPFRKQLAAKRVCLALPLARCLSFLSRDALLPSQARLLTKHRPRSLVAAEYFGIEHALSAEWPDSCVPGSHFIFPVERVRALFTSQRSLVFYTTLDFEDSLQAPSVRESIRALRRAAARVLNEKVVRQFSPGMRGKEAGTSERIVLLSVATSTPWDAGTHSFTDVKMGLPGLYTCGDHFTFATEPWKNIVDSVHETCALLTKVGLEGNSK